MTPMLCGRCHTYALDIAAAQLVDRMAIVEYVRTGNRSQPEPGVHAAEAKHKMERHIRSQHEVSITGFELLNVARDAYVGVLTQREATT